MTITTTVTVSREECEAIKAFDELCKNNKSWVCYAEDTRSKSYVHTIVRNYKGGIQNGSQI